MAWVKRTKEVNDKGGWRERGGEVQPQYYIIYARGIVPNDIFNNALFPKTLSSLTQLRSELLFLILSVSPCLGCLTNYTLAVR